MTESEQWRSFEHSMALYREKQFLDWQHEQEKLERKAEEEELIREKEEEEERRECTRYLAQCLIYDMQEERKRKVLESLTVADFARMIPKLDEQEIPSGLDRHEVIKFMKTLF